MNDLQARQVALVRRTIARDLEPAEFDLFLEMAKQYGLDPFRKQIIPIVFNKKNAEKRRMVCVPSRDGYRVIAQRCGNYRPASDPAELLYSDDAGAKSPTNPTGLISATVRLHQQDSKGDWWPVIGQALWDEYAPITDEWAWDEAKGKRQPTGKRALDASGNWFRMPVVMLTKCAEGQALRAGWPDTFSGIYAEEEMDRAVAEDASEIVRQEEERLRLERTGGIDSITITWGDNWKLEQVPVGLMADRCAEFIRDASPEDVLRWSMANQEPLRQFWARAPADALEVKKLVEAKTASLKSTETAA